MCNILPHLNHLAFYVLTIDGSLAASPAIDMNHFTDFHFDGNKKIKMKYTCHPDKRLPHAQTYVVLIFNFIASTFMIKLPIRLTVLQLKIHSYHFAKPQSANSGYKVLCKHTGYLN